MDHSDPRSVPDQEKDSTSSESSPSPSYEYDNPATVGGTMTVKGVEDHTKQKEVEEDHTIQMKDEIIRKEDKSKINEEVIEEEEKNYGMMHEV